MKNAIVIFAVIVALVLLGNAIFKSPDSSTQVTQVSTQKAEAFFPEPTNYVVDSANALDPKTVETLNAQLEKFDGRAQIAVAVVKTTKPLTIEQYGIKLAEKWKVGYKGKDNGAIIILATEDRKVRIEIGYGLEGQIPDAVAGRILDESMIPSLKNNDWNAAVVNGVNALQERLVK